MGNFIILLIGAFSRTFLFNSTLSDIPTSDEDCSFLRRIHCNSLDASQCSFVKLSDEKSLYDLDKPSATQYLIKSDELWFWDPLNEQPSQLKFINKEKHELFKQNFCLNKHTTDNLELIYQCTGHFPKIVLTEANIQCIEKADAIIYFDPLPNLKEACEFHRDASKCVAINHHAINMDSLISSMDALKKLYDNYDAFLEQGQNEDQAKRSEITKPLFLVRQATYSPSSLFSILPPEIVHQELNDLQIRLLEPKLWLSNRETEKPIWNQLPDWQGAPTLSLTSNSYINKPAEEEPYHTCTIS